MGHGYKGDTGHCHSITENLPSLKASFKYSNGYFGDPGQGRHFVRNISSDDPLATAKAFYDMIALGGKEKKMSNGKGFITVMSDESIISFREVSSSSDKSPAVEINIKYATDIGDIKYQKIHFVKG